MARPSPGAERVVAVLEFMAARPDERFTLSELARGCDLNKATAHALLTELAARGVLLRHPDEKRYSLGPRLVPVGSAAQRGYQAQDFTPGVLRRLAASTGLVAAALASDAHGDQATVVSRSDPDSPLPVPARWPLVPPNGAVFYAWADEPSVEAWLARSPAIASVQQALDALAAARKLGVVIGSAIPEWYRLTALLADRANQPPTSDNTATNGNQSAVRDALWHLARSAALITEIDTSATYRVAYVAAPVFGHDGRVILAVVAGGEPARARRGDDVAALASRVASAADELTATSHGRKPVP
jgi:DNA-binding IclR family transcriptional regulator